MNKCMFAKLHEVTKNMDPIINFRPVNYDYDDKYDVDDVTLTAEERRLLVKHI